MIDENRTNVIKYLEKDVLEIQSYGIKFNDGRILDFSECKKNYAAKKSVKIPTCVGDRNICKRQFIFYCDDSTVIVEFIKKPFLIELFTKPMHIRFYEMQKRICKLGFTTYDLT